MTTRAKIILPVLLLLLAGCSTQRPVPPTPLPESREAMILRLITPPTNHFIPKPQPTNETIWWYQPKTTWFQAPIALQSSTNLLSKWSPFTNYTVTGHWVDSNGYYTSVKVAKKYPQQYFRAVSKN